MIPKEIEEKIKAVACEVWVCSPSSLEKLAFKAYSLAIPELEAKDKELKDARFLINYLEDKVSKKKEYNEDLRAELEAKEKALKAEKHMYKVQENLALSFQKVAVDLQQQLEAKDREIERLEDKVEYLQIDNDNKTSGIENLKAEKERLKRLLEAEIKDTHFIGVWETYKQTHNL